MELNERQNAAAGEFVELVAGRLGSGRAIHPETAIASCARVAGSLMLRSFGLELGNIAPGTVVLSEEANEKGPRLVSILQGFLASNQIELDREKVQASETERGAQPSLSAVQSLELLQAEALRIAEQHALPLDKAAESAALATGFIVMECKDSLGAEVGFNVAVYGFIEGSKTAPPRLGSGKSHEKKSRFKFW